jgi:hypothetical protein
MELSKLPGKSALKPSGIDPGTHRLTAQCLNHYATPGPAEKMCRAVLKWIRVKQEKVKNVLVQ